jgi:NitT/TauT family transport system substrate-binding protein
MNISRRTLLGIAGGAVALGAGGALLGTALRATPEGRKVTVTQAVRSLAYVQSYVAAQLGYFTAEGLEVNQLDTGGGGPDVQIVLAGRAEFTVNDGAQVLPAVQQGKKLVCVLALLERAIINATMSSKTAERLGITEATPLAQKLKALKGLKIGVTRPGALTWQLARNNVEAAGLSPDRDVQIIGIGAAPALAAALEKGDVDVIYISLPVGEKVVARQSAITLINNASGEDPTLPSFMMEGLWVTPDFLKAQPDTIARMVRALRKASNHVLATSPEELAKLLAPSLIGLGDEALLAGCRMVKAAVSKSGRFTQQDLDRTQTLLEQNGFLKQRYTIGDLFNEQFLT